MYRGGIAPENTWLQAISSDGATAPGPGARAESENTVRVALNKSERDSEGKGAQREEKGLNDREGGSLKGRDLNEGEGSQRRGSHGVLSKGFRPSLLPHHAFSCLALPHSSD